MRASLFVLSCVLAVVASPARTSSQPPPRDHRPPVASPLTGDARAFGRVVDAVTRRPIRGVFVVAVPRRFGDGPLIADVRSVPNLPVATRTGEDGQFTLSELVPGEYAMVARRPGYVDQQLGQATPGTPGRQLVVDRGAVAGPIEFALIRSAVISGRVLEPSGAPADGVTVRAAQMRRGDGVWRLQGIQQATTNDLGEFRLFGLPPGSYVVSVQPDRESVVPGTFAEGGTRALVPTFAPSATSPAEAQVVRLAAGEEAEAHIHLVEAAVASVEGRVVDSSGAAVRGGFVGLHSRGAVRITQDLTTPVRPDGSFAFRGIPPGAYTAVTSPQVPFGTAEERMAVLARSEYGVLDLDVESDVTGVVLKTQPGTTIRGRLVVDGDASPLRGREVRVHATSADPAGAWNGQVRTRVLPDLTFELHGVRGAAVLRLGNAPEGWWTRAVRVGAVNTTDGHDFGMARVVADVSIVVSTKPSGLRGRVVAPSGGGVPDAMVIGFDEDERRWGRTAIANTFMVRPIDDGSWSIDMLRPGTYRVLAVPAATARGNDMSDPEYLRQLKPQTRTVVIAEGEVPELVLEVQEP